MSRELDGSRWRRLSRLLCFVFSLSFAHAELVFESNRFKVEAGAEQEKVEAFYHFENKGDKVEVITMVKSVCPLCLSAGVKGGTKGEDGFSFQPGEKGIIRAVFSTGNLAGDIEKTVEIFKAGDPEDKPSIELICEVKIPLLVKVSPRTLTWKVGEEFLTKEAVIKVVEGRQMDVDASTFKHQDFTTEFKVIVPGSEYLYRVTPKVGAGPQMQICSFATDAKSQKYKRLRVYLKVSR